MRTRTPAQTKEKSPPTLMSAAYGYKARGYSLTCPKQGCATGQGMVFYLYVLN